MQTILKVSKATWINWTKEIMRKDIRLKVKFFTENQCTCLQIENVYHRK